LKTRDYSFEVPLSFENLCLTGANRECNGRLCPDPICTSVNNTVAGVNPIGLNEHQGGSSASSSAVLCYSDALRNHPDKSYTLEPPVGGKRAHG
jgi:hypothetical protein